MADGRRHPPHLTVLAFDQFQSNPAIRHRFAETDGRIARGNLGGASVPASRLLRTVARLVSSLAPPDFRLGFEQPSAAGQGFAALDQNTFFQLLQAFRRGNLLDLHPIFAFVGMAGMQQFCVPFRFIAQEQQALGIRVEPPNRIDAFRKTKLRQRPVRRATRRARALARQVGGELRQHAERFVERDEHGQLLAAKEHKEHKELFESSSSSSSFS